MTVAEIKGLGVITIAAVAAMLISCSVTLESGIHGEYSPAEGPTPTAKATPATAQSAAVRG